MKMGRGRGRDRLMMPELPPLLPIYESEAGETTAELTNHQESSTTAGAVFGDETTAELTNHQESFTTAGAVFGDKTPPPPSECSQILDNFLDDFYCSAFNLQTQFRRLENENRALSCERARAKRLENENMALREATAPYRPSYSTRWRRWTRCVSRTRV